MAGGGLPLLATLVPETADLLDALVLEISALQTGEGADAGPGVGEGAQQSPITKFHDKGYEGPAWHVTRMSKKCRRAAST